MDGQKKKLALVFGTLPTVEEIDQFKLLEGVYDIQVISSESICDYLTRTSFFHNLTCVALPDYDENPTYLPGLENVLKGFDIVIVKERLGLYAYQAVKAKLKSQFRLVVWVDNLAPFPGDDLDEMRTIRLEVSKAADMFLVQSKAASKVLELEGIERNQISLVKPWVDKRVKRTKKNRARAVEVLGLPEGSIIVSYIGQIEWEEGLADLVAGVKLAMNSRSEVRRRLKLVFCGVGSYADELRNRLHHVGIAESTIYVEPSRESFNAILSASDAIYLSTIPGRDRVEGDPFRLITAMTNDVPVLASRSAIVEEYCGKHRLDFCVSSPASISAAILKCLNADALKQNIVKKNASVIKTRHIMANIQDTWFQTMAELLGRDVVVDSSSIDRQVLEAESRVASDQYLEAIDLIEAIFRMPEVPVHHQGNLYRLIGDSFVKLGDNDQAKEAYMKAVEIDPYASKAYVGLGTIGILKGTNDVAVLHFQKAISLAPTDEMANLGLGLAFQGMGELKEAARWIQHSLDINPANTAALFSMVQLAYDTKAFELADRGVANYIEAHPNDYNMMYTLGGLRLKQGKFQDVITLMNRILEATPQDEKAHALLSQAKNELGQTQASGQNN